MLDKTKTMSIHYTQITVQRKNIKNGEKTHSWTSWHKHTKEIMALNKDD